MSKSKFNLTYGSETTAGKLNLTYAILLKDIIGPEQIVRQKALIMEHALIQINVSRLNK